MRLTKTLTTAAASAAILAATSGASAGFVSLDEFTTVVNFPTPATFYKSLTLFITSQAGDVIPGSYFDVEAETGAFIGDELSNVPHPAAISFLDDNGEPGNQLLRFEFPDSDLWEPGETLTFKFTAVLPDTVDRFKIDWQFETVPTPGAIPLAGLAAVAGLRRRRR
jgi:MYXO-CTERM domain-containing protein